MKSLGDILKDFKLPVPPENIIEGVIENFLLDLKKKKIKVRVSFRGKTIFIKTDAYSKREILINQKKILEIIENRFPKISVEALR